MQDDGYVGPDGNVEEIPKISHAKFMKMLEPKIKRYILNRFIYRVFVLKEGRTEDQQKQVAMEIIRENICKLDCHLLTKEGRSSNCYKQTLYCSFDKCYVRVFILLICGIDNGLYDNVEVMNNYAGFVIFKGFSKTHRTTIPGNVLLIPGFEELINVYEDHNGGKFNLVGFPVKKHISAHKDPLNPVFVGEAPELKFNLMQIQIIKQIVMAYQASQNEYNPKEALEHVQKLIQDIKTNYRGNEFEFSKKKFSKIMLDLFNSVQMEGKHQSYPDMKVIKNLNEDSIGSHFEHESGIPEQKMMISFVCWNGAKAEEYCSGDWRMFCEISFMINKQDIMPWIYPSIDFTGSNKIKSKKRICREQILDFEELETLTYRNGRKETERDKKDKQQYETIAGLMDVDNAEGNADFKSVSPRVLDQKKIYLDKVDKAKKEKNQAYWILCDAKKKYQASLTRLAEAEALLNNNDQIGKKWTLIAPTIISRALDAQKIKVVQVNKKLGARAQMNRIKDPENYENQFEQVKNELLPHVEEYVPEVLDNKLQVKEEDYNGRMRKLQEWNQEPDQQKVRRPKGKNGLFKNLTPGKKQFMANIKRKINQFKGRCIVVNDGANRNIQLLPVNLTRKSNTIGMFDRNTSQVILHEKINEKNKIESHHTPLEQQSKETNNWDDDGFIDQ